MAFHRGTLAAAAITFPTRLSVSAARAPVAHSVPHVPASETNALLLVAELLTSTGVFGASSARAGSPDDAVTEHPLRERPLRLARVRPLCAETGTTWESERAERACCIRAE